MTPHQPVKVGVPDAGRATDRRPIARSKPLDDLLRIHQSQYTYPSLKCKPHMYIARGDNGAVGELQLRQILARNVADRMHRDHNLDTQAKLSAKSRVAQPHISRLLRCTTGITIDALAQLARAFGCQPWELLVDSHLTRRAALERMILGDPAPDSRVEAAFSTPSKTVALKRRRVR